MKLNGERIQFKNQHLVGAAIRVLATTKVECGWMRQEDKSMQFLGLTKQKDGKDMLPEVGAKRAYRLLKKFRF